MMECVVSTIYYYLLDTGVYYLLLCLLALHYQFFHIVTLGRYETNLTEWEQSQRSYVPTSFGDHHKVYGAKAQPYKETSEYPQGREAL